MPATVSRSSRSTTRNPVFKGNFEDVKSVKAIDKIKAKGRSKQAYGTDHEDDPTYKNPIVMLNPKGVKVGFRPVSELESELSSMNAVRF